MIYEKDLTPFVSEDTPEKETPEEETPETTEEGKDEETTTKEE